MEALLRRQFAGTPPGVAYCFKKEGGWPASVWQLDGAAELYFGFVSYPSVSDAPAWLSGGAAPSRLNSPQLRYSRLVPSKSAMFKQRIGCKRCLMHTICGQPGKRAARARVFYTSPEKEVRQACDGSPRRRGTASRPAHPPEALGRVAPSLYKTASLCGHSNQSEPPSRTR